MLCSKFHQFFVSLDKLFFGKSVFGIAGVVHDAVGDRELAARVVAAAHGLRNAYTLCKIVNMCKIIKVDISTKFAGFFVFFHRCYIR